MFMTTSKLATEFLVWLQDAAMAEEFFYATLARVDQKLYRETGDVVQGKTKPVKNVAELIEKPTFRPSQIMTSKFVRYALTKKLNIINVFQKLRVFL